MKIEVLYIADCPHLEPAVERAREALREAAIPAVIGQVEIRSNKDAEAWKFLGSPTVRVNGLDVEQEARGIQHFGVGCRSYVENGIRSGLPSKNLIRRALQEQAGIAADSVLPGSQDKNGAPPTVLVAGGVAALLASTCCLGPLILVGIGFSGAWIGNLSKLEPYRPWFLGTALIALFFAGRRIFRPVVACGSGEVCALPPARRGYKVLFGIVTALVVIAFSYPFLARFFY